MLVEVANAYTTVEPLLSQNMEFGDFILLVISLFVLISGILSIIFILYGGLLLVLSGGKEEKIKPAVNTIRYAVLGIVITVVSIFAFPILGKLLGIDVEKYAKPARILEKIEQIGNSVFGTSGGGYVVPTNSSDYEDIDTIPSDFSDL